jgi:putative RecB family exonuclease
MEPISVSQVQAYLGCPLKYRFRYIDRIPPPWRPAALAFGSSIHAAVEWFQRERRAGRTPNPSAVAAIFDADWYAQNLEPLVFSIRETAESVAEMGRKMLTLYVEQSDGRVPEATEERFEVDLVDPSNGEILDLRLRGVVDLIEDGDTLVDLKTAGRTVSSGDLERHLQLSVYALAFLLLRGRIPRLRLDMLLKTKLPRLERHATSRSLEDLGWTARLIRQVAQAIHDGHFFPNPSWRCAECEYFAHCQRWRGA